MAERSRLKEFFFPKITPAFLVRAAFVAFFAYLFFGFVCTPLLIRGRSMEPTYRDGSVTFCWKPAYIFYGPERGDVVALSLAGSKVVLLKRVVALGGETVEFRGGKLHVNGRAAKEPYVVFPCSWELPPREVETGNVYLVGDNRDQPLEQHDFGQASVHRIVGVPLW